MNTRKYPRSLEDAFGPYARGPIQEPQRPMDWQDRVVVTASAAALLAVVAMVAVGWIV